MSHKKYCEYWGVVLPPPFYRPHPKLKRNLVWPPPPSFNQFVHMFSSYADHNIATTNNIFPLIFQQMPPLLYSIAHKISTTVVR